MDKPIRLGKAALAVVAAAIVGAGLIAVFSSSDNGPEPGGVPATEPALLTDPAEVAGQFLAAWAAADGTRAQSLVAGPQAAAAKAIADWRAQLEVASVDFVAGEPEVGAGTARVPFRATVAIGDTGQWVYESALQLVLRGDGWLVEWAPATIHPSLTGGDRLELLEEWPERGLITDASGRALVQSAPTVVVGLIPERVASRPDVAAAMAEHLDVSRETIDAVLDRPGVQPDWFLPVANVAREAYVDIRPALYPVAGIAFRLTAGRVPIEGSPAAPLLGTTGEITAELLTELGPPYAAGSTVGRSGLERAFEAQLAGTPTKTVVLRRGDGSAATLKSFPGVPAADLHTTLDLEVQRAAEYVLATSELPASLVAVDIPTGAIRAVASTPATGFNRAVGGRYPPGSTFKIVVAAALLGSGMTPDTPVACPRQIDVEGRIFTNADDLPAAMSLEDAFARSCNTAFIEMAMELGADAIAATAAKFGFADELDIGIAAADASLPMPSSRIELAATAIGQGELLASPLNLAAMVAAAASGTWRPPSLVAGTPAAAELQLAPEVVVHLNSMLAAVVGHGTGRLAAVEGLEVAGKTGTAQSPAGGEAGTVAWFAGYAADLAFAVSVEGGASGGATAAPIAAEFLRRARAAGPEALPECVAAGSDWVTFQGDKTRSGCSQAAGIVEPVKRWQAEVGISGWLNSPIVAEGLVVVGSAGTTRAAGDGGDGVYALDVRSGERRWFFPTANDVNGVAGADGVVVATGDEGKVWGIDLRTGEEIWSFTAAGPVFTNPLIVGDLVVVGGLSGALWAIGTDGSPRWQAQLDGAIRGGAASDGRMVFAVSEHGDAAAFTLEGFEMWRTRVEYEAGPGSDSDPGTTPVTVFAAPTVAGDKLVVSFGVAGGAAPPAAVGLDRFVGTIAWQGSDPNRLLGTGGNVRSSAARYEESLLIAGSRGTGVQAIDGAGRAVWDGNSGVGCERQWASPVVVGDMVVLPRPDGALYSFNAATGALLWRLPLSGPAEFPPPSGCTDGVTTVSDGFELHASAAVAPDGTIIVASTSQFIYAIGDER